MQPHAFPADPTLIFPDYQGGSLLNLMQTLRSGFGIGLPGIPELRAEFGLHHDEIARARQVITLIIDGMGDALLDHHQATPTLHRHRRNRLSSVFPSTTASAIPTLFTGLPPQAHGLTGWHMWLREIGQTLSILPLSPRDRSQPDPDPAKLPEQLFQHTPISAHLPGRSWAIAPDDIAHSPFNAYHTAGAERLGYPRGLEGLAAAVFHAVDASTQATAPTWIHAYYPLLDSQMHQLGTTDTRIQAHLQAIDACVADLLKRLQGTNSLLIVTADHGFIDAPEDHLITLEQHPALAAMLTHPLCGERRLAYAYVDAAQQTDFRHYVDTHFGAACRCVASTDFIAEGWFGPGPPHPELTSRCGDFVLQMRGDWTIKDWLPGEKRYRQPGVHAGASPEEMWVPLIVAPT